MVSDSLMDEFDACQQHIKAMVGADLARLLTPARAEFLRLMTTPEARERWTEMEWMMAAGAVWAESFVGKP